MPQTVKEEGKGKLLTMFLWQVLTVFCVAGAACYIAIPASMALAKRMGAIDYPGIRRVNKKPIPRAGGIAIFFGFSAGVLVMVLGRTVFGWEADDLYSVRSVDYVLLYVGLAVVFLVGLIDDVSPISPRSKLAGQIVAAVIICLSGVTIGSIKALWSSTIVPLGWVDYPLTVIYLLVFMNIINLIDGLDGLASGIVGIVACGLMYLVYSRGSYTLVLACVIVVAVCLAFLRFNFYPAKVFMGDSGSLFLGALIASISIAGVVRTQSLAVTLVPLVIAGVPIIDTASAIVRRFRGKKPIDQADMDHLHHRLINAGFSHRRSVLMLYGLTAVLAIAGCLLSLIAGPPRWAMLALLALLAFLVIWRLRLLDPVLQHYYRRRAKEEPRRGTGADT